MANESKKPAAPGEKKVRTVSDRKRLSYLKTRFKEVREEAAAIKNEMTELKKKLGAAPKGAGAKAKGAKAAADEDDD